MKSVIKWTSSMLVVSLMFVALAQADTLCTEGTTGCVASFTLTAGGVPILVTVGSDAEVPFDPFGFGADTSDVIKFLIPAGTGITVTGLTPAWIKFTASDGNPNTWALPAAGIPGCGLENEPICEPAGLFRFNFALTTPAGS